MEAQFGCAELSSLENTWVTQELVRIKLVWSLSWSLSPKPCPPEGKTWDRITWMSSLIFLGFLQHSLANLSQRNSTREGSASPRGWISAFPSLLNHPGNPNYLLCHIPPSLHEQILTQKYFHIQFFSNFLWHSLELQIFAASLTPFSVWHFSCSFVFVTFLPLPAQPAKITG